MKAQFISTKKIIFSLFLCLGFFGPIFAVHAQSEDSSTSVPMSEEERFFRAEVMTIVRSGKDEIGDDFQDVRVRFESGDLKGTEIEVRVVHTAMQESQRLRIGDTAILLQHKTSNGDTQFSIVDLYRFPKMIFLALAFFVVVLLVVGKKRGLFSLLGLCSSIVIIMFFIVPQISSGSNPLFIASIGSFLIVTFSILLAHGINRRTLVATLGTLITLVFAVLFALFATKFGRLFGMGSEDAQFLLSSPLGALDLRGILMAGILIGTLGVLDDVTTSQSAAVEEIHLANKTLGVKELYKRGMSVGKEHIIALVNTLVLAYAGAALPVLVLLSIYEQPLWVTLSSEMIGEEIVRTLAGSMSLIFAVPITTMIGAFFAHMKENK
jgi:uncharacterized membrane protein